VASGALVIVGRVDAGTAERVVREARTAAQRVDVLVRVARRLDLLVTVGELTPIEARRLAGFLVLGAAGVRDQGSARTLRRLRAEALRHGFGDLVSS
jgi:hypothetical protein